MIVSRTILAAAVAILSQLLSMIGVEYEISVANQVIIVNGLVTLGSLVAVVWFRYKAKTDLETKTPLIPVADIKAVVKAMTDTHTKRPDIPPIVIKD